MAKDLIRLGNDIFDAYGIEAFESHFAIVSQADLAARVFVQHDVILSGGPSA